MNGHDLYRMSLIIKLNNDLFWRLFIDDWIRFLTIILLNNQWTLWNTTAIIGFYSI